MICISIIFFKVGGQGPGCERSFSLDPGEDGSLRALWFPPTTSVLSSLSCEARPGNGSTCSESTLPPRLCFPPGRVPVLGAKAAGGNLSS